MPGGAAQLSLVGKSDLMLYSNPEITFFRMVVKRPSIFSMESMPQAWASEGQFGRRVTLNVTKSGDLVHSVWVEVQLPDLSDFAVNTTIQPGAAVPGILSARWTSTTTANVKILPPTNGIVSNYEVSVVDVQPDGTEGTPVTVPGDVARPVRDTISIDNLDHTKEYKVKVRVVLEDGSTGDYSTETEIISVRWCDAVALAMLRHVDVEIGGSRILRHEGTYLDVLSELHLTAEKKEGFDRIIGRYGSSYDLFENSFQEARTVYIELQFGFNKNPGLAIPIVALTYHQLNLTFDFRDYHECIKSSVAITSLVSQTGKIPEATITPYVTFVFLGSQERQQFVSTDHEYLLEECQFMGDTPIVGTALSKKISLDGFSQPVTELIWTFNQQTSYNSGIPQSEYPLKGNRYFDYTLPGVKVPITAATIHINGQPRFSERTSGFFLELQPYAHHTRVPDATKPIYVYSFALSPEEPVISGSLNFSRVDSAHLLIKLDPVFASSLVNTNGRLRIYARSFNLLRISGGMATVMFASS